MFNYKTILACTLALSSPVLTLAATVNQAKNSDSPMMIFLTQRNCRVAGGGQDIVINKDSSAQNVHCNWNQIRPGTTIKEDIDNQMTLHMANDIDFIAVHCTFHPALVEGKSIDQLTTIKGAKALNSYGVSAPRNINGDYQVIRITNPTDGTTDVQAILRNYRNNIDDKGNYQGNIVFALNANPSAPSATPFFEDQMDCTFAPAAINLPIAAG